MKKFIKIFLISLVSLVLLLAIALSVALWMVFTPEKLTPIVRNQMSKYITCRSEIERVELTFFSSFPNFELKADRLTLINQDSHAACGDTLLRVGQVQAVVDVKAFLKNNELILNNIRFSDGTICAYIDESGRANYDIFPVDTTQTDTTSTELPFGLINISAVELERVNIAYVNKQSGMQASLSGLSAVLDGSLEMSGDVRLQLDASPFDLFYIDDSLGVNAQVQGFSPSLAVNMNADNLLRADVRIAPFYASLAYRGEDYVKNTGLELNLQADVDLPRQTVNLKNLMFSIDGMPVGLTGSVANDTLSGNIQTDLSYKLDAWNIEKLITLIPASFRHYLDGVTAAGQFSSWGTVKGIYNDSVMPLLDIRLSLADAVVNYPEMLPFPLKNVNGNVAVYTDLQDDKRSCVRIENLSVKTPKSSLRTAGKVDKLFSDVHADLTTDASLYLPEFASFIPKDVPVSMNGNVSGQLKTNLSLSQIEKMALEKMKISGSLTCNNLDVLYDTISLKTNRAKIDFALPNPSAKTKNTGFATAGIEVDRLDVKMGDNMNADLRRAVLAVETSDVRDTTKIPAIHLVFKSGTLQAGMDSMAVALETPSLQVSVAPQRRDVEQARFSVLLNSGKLNARMEKELVEADKLDVKATVFYNKNQKDLFLQWMPRGVFDLENAQVVSSMLPHTLEIPQVKMDFTPRTFEIEKAAVKLDNSDFNLSGKLTNILPYFRGDSILRGDFTLTSNHTDVNQLMNLTNGLGGNEDEQAENQIKTEQNQAAETASSGPYMVPKNMDITLHANVKEATFDGSKITKIRGDVKVYDGTLVLDELTFTTPGSDMQLTAMYQTPRRNHLYVCLDLHLLEVEIADLLNMIPNLDSIMPMLRSFGGEGEFHLAAETNLDSLYNMKMSTLRGAASIRGENLVLMDGETFAEIAKKLRFRNKKENKVDSLSAEFTVFRDKIDVYPFLITMDRYKAVVGGKHNLDMSFIYNISLVQSPLPFRASVEVTGNLEDPDFKLAKAKYPDFYRPVERKEVDTKQKELRTIIKDALTKKVVRKEDEEVVL